MRYGKLVRDRIPEIIRQGGEIPIIHTADEGEYLQRLKEKLKEEVDEFSRDGKKEELADILETLYAICNFMGIDKAGLELLRKRKVDERGSFKNRTILDRTK